MQIIPYIKAAYPVVAVRTLEPERFVLGAEAAIQKTEWQDEEGRPVEKRVFHWDVLRGYRENGFDWQEADPIALPDIIARIEHSVWFVSNYHLFVKDNGVIQALRNAVGRFKAAPATMIIVCPDLKVPLELERDVTVVDFGLPARDDIGKIVDEAAEATGIAVDAEERERIIDACQGLSWEEIDNALYFTAVQHKTFALEEIFKIKGQMLRTAGLRLLKSDKTFAKVIGLDNLKTDIVNMFKYRRPGVPQRGFLMLGSPGNGKTAIAEAAGNELGLPVVVLPLGELKGSLVGESEAKMTNALKAIDAFGKCIVLVDEIEKGLAGVGASVSTDSGTTQAWGSLFLQWLNDRTSEAFVLATCNDYSKLPPEYTRAGRWDGIYFVDSPTTKQAREAILGLYLKEYVQKALDEFDRIPDLEDYSGAEIRQVAIRTAYNGGDLQEAGRYVVPQSRSNQAAIAELREWARTRTVPATPVRIEAETKKARKVQI